MITLTPGAEQAALSGLSPNLESPSSGTHSFPSRFLCCHLSVVVCRWSLWYSDPPKNEPAFWKDSELVKYQKWSLKPGSCPVLLSPQWLNFLCLDSGISRKSLGLWPYLDTLNCLIWISLDWSFSLIWNLVFLVGNIPLASITEYGRSQIAPISACTLFAMWLYYSRPVSLGLATGLHGQWAISKHSTYSRGLKVPVCWATLMCCLGPFLPPLSCWSARHVAQPLTSTSQYSTNCQTGQGSHPRPAAPRQPATHSSHMNESSQDHWPPGLWQWVVGNRYTEPWSGSGVGNFCLF